MLPDKITKNFKEISKFFVENFDISANAIFTVLEIKKLEETAIKKQNDANQKTVMLSCGESVYNDMKNQIKKIWQNYDFECCIKLR